MPAQVTISTFDGDSAVIVQRRLHLVSLLSMVLVSACSEGSGSVVAPEPNIQISFDRNTTSTRPKATVSLGTDHSVSVAASGHQMTIKGNTGLIDGKYRVRFTKETADMIESGICEIENQQTVASRKLQQAYVEYDFLKIDRAATAQEMRNHGCV